MVIFYKKWKTYTEIQLTKSKMDLNTRKMTNHPPTKKVRRKRGVSMERSKAGKKEIPKTYHYLIKIQY